MARATAKSQRSGEHRAAHRGVHPTLKRLILIISSRTQGCTYCTAHSCYGANQLGVGADKIAAVFEFETSPLFKDVQRVVLRVAWHGALQPNAITDKDFEALKAHFSDREIVEIVAVFSLYGYLNRCGTLNTELEPPPAALCGLAARVDPC